MTEERCTCRDGRGKTSLHANTGAHDIPCTEQRRRDEKCEALWADTRWNDGGSSDWELRLAWEDGYRAALGGEG